MKPKTLASWGLLGLTSLALAVLLAYLSRWQQAIFSLIPLLSGLLGFILVLMALLAWGLAKGREAAGLRRTGRFLLLAGFFLLLQLTYLPIAQAFRQQEVTRAKAFIEALIPRIEAYKGQHGVYPATLQAIPSEDVALPALLQLQGDPPFSYNNQDFYFQSGGTYGFRFYLPDGFIGFNYEYCCGPQGHWTVTD